MLPRSPRSLRPALRALLAATLLIVAAAPVALAAPQDYRTGSIDPSPEDLAELIPFEPEDIEFVEQPAVDLRRWLPPVGQQQMNDCTAWAVAYAAKTYLEARDQGWTPDRPERIFSPNFVYNQINGGEDKGSNFVKAIQLMMRSGAATLGTFPYQRNHAVQPTAKQTAEAAAFPVFDGRLLKKRLAIRRALQRREIVVFGAHLGPIFMSGRWPVYTNDMFVQDVQLREEGQPHGKHAMVIAGYDDERQAFLVLNSWGTKWGERGYCWLSYGLFDEIRVETKGEVFCNWACTIVDVEEDVERGPDGLWRPKPKNLNTLQARGHSDIARYSKELGAYVYVFTAELTGQRAAMDDVTAVTWSWLDETGTERSHRVTSRNMRFGIQAGTCKNPLDIRGVAELADGKEQKVYGRLVGPNPKADWRHGTIVFEDHFFEQAPGRQPTYEVRAKVDFPLEQRNDITKVQWDWSSNVRGQPRGFTLGSSSWQWSEGWTEGPVTATARVHYVDGGVKTIEGSYRPSDPVVKGFHVVAESRVDGRRSDGGTDHLIKLSLDFPQGRWTDVKSMHWTVDRHMASGPLKSHEFQDGYFVHVRSHRDFRARAHIEFKDGTKEVVDRWVELGKGTAYPDDRRAELAITDTFMGRFGKGPRWRAIFEVIGDHAVLDRATAVVFRTEDGRPVDTRIEAGERFWCSKTYDGARSFPVSAILQFEDGTSITLERAYAPQSPVNDVKGLGVSVRERRGPGFLSHPELLYDLMVEPLGPEDVVELFHSVDWLHTVGSRRERTQNRTRWYGVARSHWFHTSFGRPFELVAWAHGMSGWNHWFATPISNRSRGDLRPSIRLDVRERFYGYDESGTPLWIVRASPRFDESVHPATSIESWTQVSEDDRGARYKANEVKAAGATSFLVRRPTSVTGTVKLTDGSTVEIAAYAPTWSERTAEPIELRTFRRESPADGDLYVQVNGWHKVISEIETLHLDPAPAKGQEVLKPKYRDGYGLIRFRGITAPTKLTATATMKDGTKHVVTTTLDPTPEPLGARTEMRYWGDGQWETTLLPTGDWFTRKQVTGWNRSYLPEVFDEIHAWPPGGGRYRGKTSKTLLRVKVGVRHDPESQVPITFAHGPAPGQTSGWELDPPEKLAIRIGRPPEHIAKRAKGEWNVWVEGPEKDMIRIESATWSVLDGDGGKGGEDGANVKESFTIGERWGELREGFEGRVFSGEQPKVRVVLKMRDGSEVRLGGN